MDYVIIRAISSFLAGMLISQSGSLVQLSSRNILSSPSTLGFDGLAVLWLLVVHSLSLLFQFELTTELSLIWGVPVFILIGYFFSFLLKGKKKLERIILLGITFNLLVGAVFSLWQFLFMAFNLPFPIELWFGHFRYASSSSAIVLIITEMIIFIYLLRNFKMLKMLSLGPIMKVNWGLDERKLLGFVFITASVSTFIVISLFGSFSFLGLIFPIIARKVWFKSKDLNGEFFYGSLMNGLLLMGVDLLCYFSPIYGAEVPVGLIVTGIGALSLIVILWTNAKDS